MANVHRITYRLLDVLSTQHQRLQLHRKNQRAISELRAYSDAQLEDLGLSRGTIAYAVRHGRLHFGA